MYWISKKVVSLQPKWLRERAAPRQRVSSLHSVCTVLADKYGNLVADAARCKGIR